MREVGFRLKYENEDAFDVISSELQDNISDGVQIDDAYNQIDIFLKNVHEENMYIISKALNTLCNIYFPNNSAEIVDLKITDVRNKFLLSKTKALRIIFPEHIFKTVRETSDFLFKLYRMFYGRLEFIADDSFFPFIKEQELNFLSTHHGRLSIDSGMTEIRKMFIKPFFKTEERQRAAYEEFTKIPFEKWCAYGAYYVAIHGGFQHKYYDIDDITDKVQDYIGRQIHPNQLYLGVANPGYARYKSNEISDETEKMLLSNPMIRRIVICPFEKRNDNYINVVATISEPFFNIRHMSFLILYVHCIIRNEDSYELLVKKFVETVCVE